MKIFWSPKARNDFENILDYLLKEWGIKEVESLIKKTDRVLNAIAQNPKMFIESSKRKNVRKGFITKHNSVFYLVKSRNKEVVLLTFWDNRQNPEKLIY